MKSTILNLLIWPAIGLIYPVVISIVGVFLPVGKEIVHVTSLNEPVADWQYPVLSFVGLVQQYGYTAEEFKVTTSDGYILGLHRISGSPRSPKAPGKPVIYIQHGLVLSSDSWVLTGPDSDLAFLLSDQGYDVWIGNVRGNTYSRAHISKNPKNEDFWDFSYHDMAIYDLPAIINHILKVTEAKRLTYFGFSMGTTMGYALLSTLPEFGEKIDMIYNFGPAVFWKHELPRFISFLVYIFDGMQSFFTYFNIHEVLPQTALLASIGKHFCSNNHIFTQPICLAILANIGMDMQRLNKTAVPNILAHFPAGTSTLNLYHYQQIYEQDQFAAYDFGAQKNFKKYGNIAAPVYNLSKVHVPVRIWYGEGDDLINEKDAFEIAKRLPNLISIDAVKHNKFNHFDFLWAEDAKELVYDLAIETLQEKGEPETVTDNFIKQHNSLLKKDNKCKSMNYFH